MTATFVTTLVTSANQAYILDGSDQLVVTPLGTVISTGNQPIVTSGSNNTVVIDGYVTGLSEGIQLGFFGAADANDVLTIGPGGVLTGTTEAAIRLTGDNATILNAGLIQGRMGLLAGLFDNAGPRTLTVSNSGTIQARNNGVLIYDAVDVFIDNSGTMATTSSPGFTSGNGNSVIELNGFGLHVSNSGTMSSYSNASYGVALYGGDLWVANSGLIQTDAIGDTRAAVVLETLAGQSSRLDNAAGGSIVAPGLAVRGGLGSDSVTNAGDILGEVRLHIGDDRLTNRGGIDGDVTLGDGDDIYLGRGEGIVTGAVLGGGGTDVLTGSRADDSLAGGEDADILAGGAGADLLVGGAGRDTQTGGADGDLFVFLDTTDSPQAAPDTIRDFTPGEDLIDLEAIFAAVLAFVGTGPFVGGNTGSVRYNVSTGGRANVLVDVDGDGVADMRIFVRDTPVLEEGNFLL